MTLVARLKVTLSDVEPEVLRRFNVPLKIRLNRLHDGPLPASKTSLLNVIEDTETKTIHYIYDFGDNHMIRVEKIDDAILGADYPRLFRAIGACPPEDVGGVPGYAEFLQARADPNH